MNAIDNITRSENRTDSSNWIFPAEISEEHSLYVSKGIRDTFDRRDYPEKVDAINSACEYLKETGLVKYITLLNSNQNYLSLIRKTVKTEQDIAEIKRIEKSAIHGNRYRNFKNGKNLRTLVGKVFGQELEENKKDCIVNGKTYQYNLRKNYLKTGAERIGRKFNESVLNDFILTKIFEQKRREELARDFGKSYA